MFTNILPYYFLSSIGSFFDSPSPVGLGDLVNGILFNFAMAPCEQVKSGSSDELSSGHIDVGEVVLGVGTGGDWLVAAWVLGLLLLLG